MGWHWQTMVFTVLAFLQLAHAMAVRSERASTFRLGFRTNRPLLITVVVTALIQLAFIYLPFLQPIFETEALGLEELLVVALVTPIPFIAVEIEKWVFRRRERGPSARPGGLGRSTHCGPHRQRAAERWAFAAWLGILRRT